MGSALQPPFRKAIVGIAVSDPKASARRLRLIAKFYFAFAAICVAMGVVFLFSDRRITFITAYPIVAGFMIAINGLAFLNNARKIESGGSMWPRSSAPPPGHEA
jgi:hypothetical protein